jgi:hypothetical protein
LLVLIASTDEALVRIAGATINERTANGLDVTGSAIAIEPVLKRISTFETNLNFRRRSP